MLSIAAARCAHWRTPPQFWNGGYCRYVISRRPSSRRRRLGCATLRSPGRTSDRPATASDDQLAWSTAMPAPVACSGRPSTADPEATRTIVGVASRRGETVGIGDRRMVRQQGDGGVVPAHHEAATRAARNRCQERQQAAAARPEVPGSIGQRSAIVSGSSARPMPKSKRGAPFGWRRQRLQQRTGEWQAARRQPAARHRRFLGNTPWAASAAGRPQRRQFDLVEGDGQHGTVS